MFGVFAETINLVDHDLINIDMWLRNKRVDFECFEIVVWKKLLIFRFLLFIKVQLIKRSQLFVLCLLIHDLEILITEGILEIFATDEYSLIEKVLLLIELFRRYLEDISVRIHVLFIFLGNPIDVMLRNLNLHRPCTIVLIIRTCQLNARYIGEIIL